MAEQATKTTQNKSTKSTSSKANEAKGPKLVQHKTTKVQKLDNGLIIANH